MSTRNRSSLPERPVRIATGEELEPVGDALLLAFVRDPVARFVFSEPSAYRGGFGAFIRSFARPALAGGTAFAAQGYGGAALWMAPGMASDDSELMEGFSRWVAAEKLPTAGALMEEMMKRHPEEPHLDCRPGVSPALPGRATGCPAARIAGARGPRTGAPYPMPESRDVPDTSATAGGEGQIEPWGRTCRRASRAAPARGYAPVRVRAIAIGCGAISRYLQVRIPRGSRTWTTGRHS